MSDLGIPQITESKLTSPRDDRRMRECSWRLDCPKCGTPHVYTVRAAADNMESTEFMCGLRGHVRDQLQRSDCSEFLR